MSSVCVYRADVINSVGRKRGNQTAIVRASRATLLRDLTTLVGLYTVTSPVLFDMQWRITVTWGLWMLIQAEPSTQVIKQSIAPVWAKGPPYGSTPTGLSRVEIISSTLFC